MVGDWVSKEESKETKIYSKDYMQMHWSPYPIMEFLRHSKP